MKILLLIDSLNIGGAETHVELLAKSFHKLGHEVCVASAGGTISKRLTQIGINYLPLPSLIDGKELNSLAFLHNLLIAYRIISNYIKVEKPDIVHAHTRRTAFLVDKICKRYKIPLVVTAHAKFSMKFPKNLFSKWGNSTIAVSDDIKNHLVCHGAPKKQIKVIKNGVNLLTDDSYCAEITKKQENSNEKNSFCQPS